MQEFMKKGELLEAQWDIAEECANRITQTFENPIDLELEKIMYPLYLYRKKKYANKLYEKKKDEDGNYFFDSKKDYKGISIVRRDSCKLVKTISNPVLEMLLDHNDIDGAIKVVHDAVEKLLQNQYPIEEFVITKAINNDYSAVKNVKKYITGEYEIPGDFIMAEDKNGKSRKVSVPGHVVLAKNINSRNVIDPPNVGDRIPFVYIENEDNKAIGRDRMEDPDYLVENPDKCKIDVMFYLEKQIASPLYGIFEVLVKNKDNIMYPRKEKTVNGKQVTEITKECKECINQLLFNDLIRKYRPGPNFFIKKIKVPKVPKTRKKKEKTITSYFKTN